jgi:hypothetical protein
MNVETRGFGEAEMQETVLPMWLEIEERKTEIRCLRGGIRRLYHAVKWTVSGCKPMIRP